MRINKISFFTNVAILISLLVVLLLFISSGSLAQNTVENNSQYINKTKYYFDKNYEINENINGDLFCFGNNITINANIDGDILCAGSTINVNGLVSGDVRAFASTVNIIGRVEGSATLVGQDTSVQSQAVISKDITTLSNFTLIKGQISRNANIYSNEQEITGTIGGDLTLNSLNGTLPPESNVYGNIIIDGNKFDSINNSGINNHINSNAFDYLFALQYISSILSIIIGVIYIAFIIGLIISGLIIALLFPRSLKDGSMYVQNQPWLVMLAGFLILWFTPTVISLLFVSIIGMPLAVALAGLYVSLIVLSVPFSAFALGNKLLPKRSIPIKSLAGSSLLLIVFAVPIINIIFFALAIIFGAGMIVRVATLRYTQARLAYLSNS